MNMVKSEWRMLLQNPRMLLVVFGLLFIPMVYASLFLIGSWDPYKNIDQLPVAVVNEDVEANYEDSTLRVGQELIENLEDNDNLGWHIVDRDNAMDGLDNGDYYMTVIIPDNFSRNAASVLSDNPEEMKLEYYTSDGRSFMAANISQTAAESLKQEIAKSVTHQYTVALFDQLGSIGDGFQDAVDGTTDLKDGNRELSDNLAILSDSTLTFEDGLASAEEGSEEIALNVGDVIDGSQELAEAVQSYTSGVFTLQEGLFQYVDGSSELNAGVNEYVNGVAQLNNGIFQYTSGVDELDQGIQGYTSSMSTVNNGFKQYVKGVYSLEEGMEEQKKGVAALASRNETLQDGSTQLTKGTIQLVDSMTQVENGAHSLEEQSQTYFDSVEQLANGSANLQASIQEVAGSIEGVPQQADQLVTGLEQLQETLDQASTVSVDTAIVEESLSLVKNEVASLKDQLENTEVATMGTEWIDNSGVDLTEEQSEQLKTAFADSKPESSKVTTTALSESLSSLSTSITEIQGIQNDLPEQDLTELIKGAESLKSGYDELKTVFSSEGNGSLQAGASQLSVGLHSLNENSSSLSTGIGEVAAGVSQLHDGASDLQSGTTSLSGGIEQYTGGVDQLKEASSQLQEGTSRLSSKSNDLLEGSQKLEDAGNELSSGSSQLTQGSSTLTHGMEELMSSGSDLNSGANQLVESGEDLQEGSEQLITNNDELNNGAQQIANGVPQLETAIWSLNSGINELYLGANDLSSGSSELYDGSKQLLSGTEELASSLEDGANDISNVNRDDENATMFSSPTSLIANEVTSLPNYGYGMAPYMMAVSLFLGAVIFCILVPVGRPSMHPTSGISWWFSKFSLLFIVSVLQAVIMVSIVLMIGIEPQSIMQLFMVAIVSSLAFMAIVQFFSVVFGNPGRFIVLVIMVLQLTASGGTFPVELLNSFFQTISPFLPMTHSIEAYREAISIGGTITTEMISLLSYFVLFHLGTFMFFTIKSRKGRSVEQEELSL
ncbi:YhgE/Pip domain-containing protein [Salipaludibacillus neizhouensis]|nr:YhgE/Pip domain-containing protein [Salipaludibacillus neizhouensis]